MITQNSFAKALWPGVNAWYGKGYKDYKPEWVYLVDRFTSRKAWEEDVGVTSFGLPRKVTEGGTFPMDEERQTYLTRYVHAVWGLGFTVTRLAYDDNLYPELTRRKATGLARSMRHGKETVVANLYNRATNGSYTGGDGVSLLSNAHPNFAGGTQSNIPTAHVDISENALEQACIDIAKWTDDRGLKIRVMPKTLILPVDTMFDIHRLLKSPYRPGTSDNDVNALYDMGKFKKIVINHYLTDTDAWFIRTDAPHGMKLFQRDGMEFSIDNDWDTENAKYKARERYSAGWSDWRGMYGSTGG